MPAKRLDTEIMRLVKQYCNYVEPTSRGVVQRADVTCDIKIKDGNITGVPKCDGVSVKVGDNVVVAFLGGQWGSPIIVGKIPDGV